MPVLEIITVLLMLAVAYSHSREGVLGSVIMFFNILAAGFMAFNFWEPLAWGLSRITDGFLERYADAICLVFLFCVSLGLLRLLTSRLAPDEIELHPVARQIGGGVFGLASGYFTAAILFCIFQTLPWHERFLWYDPANSMGLAAPDRVWLAVMHRASGEIFDHPAGDEKWFDADGSFIPRYARYRRYAEERDEALENQGEFAPTIPTRKPSREE